MLKQNTAPRDLIGGEVANGYQPHQIFRNMQGHHRGPEAHKCLLPPEESICSEEA